MVDLFRQQNQALNRLGQTAQFAANERQRGTANALAQDRLDLSREQSEFNQGIATDQNLRQEAQSYRQEGVHQQKQKEDDLANQMRTFQSIFDATTPLVDKIKKGGTITEDEYNKTGAMVKQLHPGAEIPPFDPNTSPKQLTARHEQLRHGLGKYRAEKLVEQEQDFKLKLARMRAFKEGMARIKASKEPSAAKIKMKQELLNQDFITRQSANGVQFQANQLTGALGGTIKADQRAAFEADAKKSGYKAYFTEGGVVDQPGLAWPPSKDNVQMLNVDLVKDPNFKATDTDTPAATKKESDTATFIDEQLSKAGIQVPKTQKPVKKAKPKPVKAKPPEPAATKKEDLSNVENAKISGGWVWGEVDGVKRRVLKVQGKTKKFGNREYPNENYEEYLKKLKTLGLK